MTRTLSTPRTLAALALGLLTALPPALHGQTPTDAALRQRVERVLATVPLIDGHNDLPGAILERAGGDVGAYDLRARAPGDTDLERLRAGRVGGQFWSVYVPSDAPAPARAQLEQIDIALRMIRSYPDHLELATSASDVERIFGGGRIASLLGIEGGHVIENSLGALRAFHRAGVRYMTLTHFSNTDWADSATDDPVHGGLSAFGEEVVREMNRLGMLVDLSHVAPATMHDALDVSAAPVIFSHSGAAALSPTPRNVPDDVLSRLRENGGVVMQVFYPGYVAPDGGDSATLAQVADHIEHIRDVAGIDHVGLGSDFDGIPAYVDDLEDVSTFPALFVELARRGWTDGELAKLAGENVLRVMREAEAVSRRMGAEGR
ncbi:MAG: dipeptidase [Longimicrobiales bacterium]